MKAVVVAGMVGVLLIVGAPVPAYAGEVDILVGKLVEKGVLTPAEAQIIMDETRIQVSKDLAQAKSLSVPEWTQRIKWGGDVRYRTQGDWGKKSTNPDSTIRDQQWRNRVRGRFFIEGKVNDFTYAGARFAGGLTKANSTNDTLNKYWDKNYVMFDQYYMRFEAPQDLVRKYSMFFSDAKLWAGRFPIPFSYSELVWDSDINPTGVALQYTSPDVRLGGLPSFNAYTNLGMLWLDEFAQANTDPILWAGQIGVKTEEFGPLASTLDMSTAIYNFANIKDKSYTGSASANTNTRWTRQDVAANDPLIGKWKFEYDVLDLLISLDNKKIGDKEFPHGLYGDFIHNFGCPVANDRSGVMVGGYIGKKKIKDPGDWKVRCEWRYIERDAIPDFMPDSDFYGFGTYSGASATNRVNWGNNGLPAEGGTNGKGVNLALEYQLFKNTSLNFEYYWMKPIASWDKRDPWNELQMDVVTKF